MSLIIVVGLWLLFGGSIYRDRRRVQSMSEEQVPVRSSSGLNRQPSHTKIPDTVPSDWMKAYRAEHGA